MKSKKKRVPYISIVSKYIQQTYSDSEDDTKQAWKNFQEGSEEFRGLS